VRWIAGVLDRLVLLTAVVAAACVPSFIVQYRQRLGGRLDQVLADLAPFQAIANRNFGGDLGALIRHHLASADPTFHAEGAALQGMVSAAARLRSAAQALNTDLIHQCVYLARHADPQLVSATWHVYQPGFTLTLQGAAFALVLGGLIWLLLLGAGQAAAGAVRWRRRRRTPQPPQRPSGGLRAA
jgi:hypothetical protein